MICAFLDAIRQRHLLARYRLRTHKGFVMYYGLAANTGGLTRFARSTPANHKATSGL